MTGLEITVPLVLGLILKIQFSALPPSAYRLRSLSVGFIAHQDSSGHIASTIIRKTNL